MRPTNVKSLGADLLNSFDKNGKLLLNLGLEVTPYWLQSHPQLSRATYLHPNTVQTIVQSFTLSAATVKDSVAGTNKMGAGFRFKVYNGEPLAELETANEALKTRTMVVAILNGIKSVVGAELNTKQKALESVQHALTKKQVPAEIIDALNDDAKHLLANYSDEPNDIRSFLDELITLRVAAYRELASHVSDLLYQRNGMIVEFAGASRNNTTNARHQIERSGFWANASYYVSPDDLFTLTARYMFQNNDSSLSNFDAGLSFLKKTNQYNIAIECMLRYYSAAIPDVNINNQPIKRLQRDFTYRFAAQGSYKISNLITVNLSLGKDFNSPFISKTGFFSILGLNYSLFSKIPSLLPN